MHCVLLAAVIVGGVAGGYIPPAPTLALTNNCFACVRCGGVWASQAGTDSIAGCVDPADMPAGRTNTTLPLASVRLYGFAPVGNCVGKASAECPIICPTPCALADNRCGPCSFAQEVPPAQCVVPGVSTGYAYAADVLEACNMYTGSVRTNLATMVGDHLPICDCPPGGEEEVVAGGGVTLHMPLAAAAGGSHRAGWAASA